MRQGFIIGAIMLWVGINLLGSIGEYQTPLAQVDSNTGLTGQQTLEGLTKPEVTDVNIVTIFSKVWDVLKMFGKIITLWHPAIWQGSLMYVYFFVVMPIGISFWVVILLALRGTGSG